MSWNRSKEERAKQEETRKWRNRFYGLPMAYQASPNWGYTETGTEADVKRVKADIKSLWASVDRARRGRKS